MQTRFWILGYFILLVIFVSWELWQSSSCGITEAITAAPRAQDDARDYGAVAADAVTHTSQKPCNYSECKAAAPRLTPASAPTSALRLPDSAVPDARAPGSQPMKKKKFFAVLGTFCRMCGGIIEEWVLHHMLVGFDHLIIIQDLDKDEDPEGIAPLLKGHITSGFVTLWALPHYKNGNKGFGHMYDQLVTEFRPLTQWLGIWDTDEFFTLSEPFVTLSEVLQRYEQYGGLLLWVRPYLYGKHWFPSDRLFVEDFRECCMENALKTLDPKPLMQVEHVKLPFRNWPHYVDYNDGSPPVNERFQRGMSKIGRNKLRDSQAAMLNRSHLEQVYDLDHFPDMPSWRVMALEHYYTGSFTEWVTKVLRGQGDARSISSKNLDQVSVEMSRSGCTDTGRGNMHSPGGSYTHVPLLQHLLGTSPHRRFHNVMCDLAHLRSSLSEVKVLGAFIVDHLLAHHRFDEIAFLERNRDAAQLVCSGAMASGFDVWLHMHVQADNLRGLLELVDKNQSAVPTVHPSITSAACQGMLVRRPADRNVVDPLGSEWVAVAAPSVDSMLISPERVKQFCHAYAS